MKSFSQIQIEISRNATVSLCTAKVKEMENKRQNMLRNGQNVDEITQQIDELMLFVADNL